MSGEPVASDHPSADGKERAPDGMSFWIDAGAPRTLRVILDNCPQWYGLRGRTLYLRHAKEVEIRGLKLLVRSDALAQLPPGAAPDGTAANAPPQR